jgi:hypothetical protein
LTENLRSPAHAGSQSFLAYLPHADAWGYTLPPAPAGSLILSSYVELTFGYVNDAVQMGGLMETTTVVQLIFKDGLMLPSGFVAPAAYSCVIFCRVPTECVEGDHLNAAKLEAVFENLYGANWRAGNVDGSRYVVGNVQSHVLTSADEQTAPWQSVSNNSEYHYWFFHDSATGELQAVTASEF